MLYKANKFFALVGVLDVLVPLLHVRGLVGELRQREFALIFALALWWIPFYLERESLKAISWFLIGKFLRLEMRSPPHEFFSETIHKQRFYCSGIFSSHARDKKRLEIEESLNLKVFAVH